jgi:hypothetical protein
LIAAELAVTRPLADPEHFLDAHRLTMRALEVLDREGSRATRLPRLGPLTPAAGFAVETIAGYIVRSYASSVANRLRTLYTRRESQCLPSTPERRMLARTRVEMDRLAPGYASGLSGLPTLLLGGAAVPIIGALSSRVLAINFADRAVVLFMLLILFVAFFALSWALLQGAGVAHRRARLIMQLPLAALWETIGHAGNPPQDDSTTYATVGIVLTALLWFLIPAAAAAAFFL